MIKTITHTQYWKDCTSHYIMTDDGIGMVRITDMGDEMEISDLFVHQADRKRGIATRLLEDAIHLCKTVKLHGKIVIMTNYNSEHWVSKWYKRLGFRFERAQAPLTAVFDIGDRYNVYSMEF